MFRKSKDKNKKSSEKSSVETSEKRILVIGHTLKSRSLKSFKWKEFPKDYNIADYDVVIIDFTTIDEPPYHKDHPIESDYLINFLSNPENEMLLIGKPYHFKFKVLDSNSTYIIDFENLFPFFPAFIEAQGEEIRDVVKEYSYYFSKVKRWNRQLKYKTISELRKSGQGINRWSSEKMFGSDKFSFQFQSIANTVSKHPIAVVFNFQSTEKLTAKVVCLPKTTEIPAIEGIKLILKYRYGFKFESKLPEWVECFKLPEQMEIEEKISDLNNKKFEIDKEINSLSIRLKENIKFQELLYESGNILAYTVHDALELIGATVDRTEKFQDDGLFTDPFDRRYTLEIKGVVKSAARSHIRQLEDWKEKAEVDNGWKGKGLLIVNAYKELPLQERRVPFPDDCVNKAEFEKICLLTTTQLFKALQTFQEGKLDRKDFWDAIYNSNGICDLPELCEN